jgi:hypothetical protein
LYLWGIDRYDSADGQVLWTSGSFGTFSEAERYRQRYLTQHKNAIVLTCRNGEPLMK